MNHIPVLLEEVIQVMNPHSGGRYIDGTAGDGGHTAALLNHSEPSGCVLALDQDKNQIEVARRYLARFDERVTLVHSRFSQMSDVAQRHGFDPVDGILLDLGISSRQLDDPTYGLNLSNDTVLDMRLHDELRMSAADFLNHANEREIADVLYLYGDRHNSRSLAHKIVTYRKKKAFRVAHDLKEAVHLFRPADLAPIFQALRIWVNQEYSELEAVLPQTVSLLKSEGVLAIITFHSGEDRIVKQFLKSQRELLTVPKFIRPTLAEMKQNSRSRSATLRYAIKK